ncbi:MAG: threonine--tRNA ligase, partial [Candidatus Limnocylindria bacterium]
MPKRSRGVDHGEDALYALRHSTAHVMAGAVLELFPEAKFGFGPPVADGFYYDFDLPRPLVPEDLGRIEERMRRMVERDVPFERGEMPVGEAREFFAKRGQDYKVDQVEHLDEAVGENVVGIYTHDGFVDLCRGPHVERTGKIGAFKLMTVAGAYWRGDEAKPQLQRVYGTVWPTQGELDAYLARLKEVERRDHRRIGQELELFHVDEELGGGLILWLPNGSVMREAIEDYWRALHHQRGYTLVYTPHLASERLFTKSGHLANFRESMFGPIELESDFWVKPMNCPGHIKIFQARVRSYRELPLRLGEIGTVYRNERGGTLHGLLRVRSISQDDAHIFCTPSQVAGEVTGVLDLALEVYALFGFTASLYLSTRPEQRLGTDPEWDEAERALTAALEAGGHEYLVDAGGGAFYGPKIDIKVTDAIGREWQLCTIQLDLQQPQRFDIRYVSERGERERVVMIHRVILGALERFFGVLIEHFAGAFPLWIAPVQAAVVPVRESARPYADEVASALRGRGLRVWL